MADRVYTEYERKQDEAAAAKRRSADRDQRLGEYGQFQKKQADDLTRGFRQFSEAQTGRAMGNVLRQASIGANRQGLAFSGLWQGAITGAHARLQGAALGAQQGFASQLAAMQSQNYDRALQGEFQYAMEIDKMMLNQQFEKDLMYMQQEMRRSSENRDAFLGLAGSIGGWLGGGPIGAAIGGKVGSWFGGDDPYASGSGRSVYGYQGGY